MSVSAFARTLTNKELLDRFELAPQAERNELAHELYVRLFRKEYGYAVAAGSKEPHSAQTQLL